MFRIKNLVYITYENRFKNQSNFWENAFENIFNLEKKKKMYN